MKELLPIIDEITKFGLTPNLNLENKEYDLEKNLIKFYSLSFDINFKFDENDYPDFDKTKLPNIIENIKSNFSQFGFYNTILDINAIDNTKNVGLGDAVDDLLDITFDLLEIKWRIQNNSLDDALWFFNFIFNAHTKQHIIDLLNFLKQTED